MAQSVSSSILFSDLCTTFENIKQAKKAEKAQAFLTFLKSYSHKGTLLKTLDSKAETSFYPALRLIVPQLERQRGTYGLKEFTLAKRIVKILCLPAHGADATRLTNFRTSGGSNINVKDFADAAFWVLRKHFITNSSKLTIADVNTHLDLIAQKNADNDPRGVDAQLLKLLQETSPEEQKWLIRIILKDIRLGIGSDPILRLFHPDAPEYFSTNESIIKVCETLTDPSVRLHEIEISIFTPFRPMLSQRCELAQINKLNFSTRFITETKFDGERFQLHMKDGIFKFYSRNGYDYTSTFGSDYSSGIYTPLIASVFVSNTREVILDGEMMGWNTKTKRFGSKGMNFDVKHLTKDNVHQPCFCVFDILLLNGKVLTNKPLSERLAVLKTVIRPVYGVIMLSQFTESTSKQDILNALNLSMDNKEEGIVFKDPLSIYKCNDRKSGWWKMKLEYFENVMNDLDVVVIGGYYGEGRHRLSITGFLVAVIDNTTNPITYLSFAKIATGLGNDELEIVNNKLNSNWKKLAEGNPDTHGIIWRKEKPDVWIEPHNSCALLVRGSELSRSADFATNFTLRFPRIQKIRLDKPIQDCLNTTELQEFISSSNTSIKKLNKRHLELDDLVVEGKERKSRRRAVNYELKPVEKLSHILKGFQFCVLSGYGNWKKEDVETEIRENGGTVVPIEGPDTLCILVGGSHPRVESCRLHNAPYDLVQLEWLRYILDLGVFKLYEPKYMLHTSPKTLLLFKKKFDKFGDSYTDHVTWETIRDLVKGINSSSNNYIHLMPSEMKSLDDEIHYNNLTHAFQNYVGYFDSPNCDYQNNSEVARQFAMEEVEFRFLGGTISNTLDKHVNLIVTDMSNQYRVNNILSYLTQIKNVNAKIIDKNAISQKITEVKHLLEVP